MANISLEALFESKAEKVFREYLWEKGDDKFGEGFLQHCCVQKPFITLQGKIEATLGGMAASEWVEDMTSKQPSPLSLSIAKNILCIPEFIFVLDDIVTAIFLEINVRCDELKIRRTMHRALIYLGIMPITFGFDEVVNNPKSCVEQTLDLLDRIHQLKGISY